MQYTHLKFAFCSLWRNKFYSLINMGGLAIGIVVSMLIPVFVGHELSFDRLHKNADNFYRLKATCKFGDREVQDTNMSAFAYCTGQSSNCDSKRMKHIN